MSRKKKNGVGTLIDSFITSVNRTGGSSWSVAAIFLIGGTFSAYVGYTSPSLLLMFGGGIAMLIGFMLCYKAWYSAAGKKRKHRA